MSKKIKVAELFAGVGGFRLGLEKSNFDVVWSNQWEPSTKIQHASMVYVNNFGSANHSNDDINTINPLDIPPHEMLVGGFPCQDFSVGSLNKFSKGLKGKKGVLWFSIKKILEKRSNAGKPTKYLFLENVDRLLKCPVNLKGEDFRQILKHLNELDYAVEWQVINAGDYGMPQRRRRIFILAYHKSTTIYKKISKSKHNWINNEEGVLLSTFKHDIDNTLDNSFRDLKNIKIDNNTKTSPFSNSGIMINNSFYTRKLKSKKSNPDKLKNNLLSIDEYSKYNDEPEEFFVSKKDFNNKWIKAKGSKSIKRIGKDGFSYTWAEGSMSPTDDLNKPSRTIITSEGGKSASRTKHIVNINGQHRRLFPIELERLNMFPDDFTKFGLDENGKKVKILNTKRAFLMGNALVVNVISKIGKVLSKKINV